MVKNLPAMKETQIQFLSQKDPLEKEWQLTAVFLPGESHEQRSLADYSSWCRKAGRNWSTNTFIFLFFFFWRSDYLSFVTKLLYNLASHAPQNSSVRVTWDVASWTWSPKNSHQIKHNSQLLGHEYFLSPHQEEVYLKAKRLENL